MILIKPRSVILDTLFLVQVVCSDTSFSNHSVTDRYKFIALLDTDEVIIPIKHANWMDMMDDVVGQLRDKKKEFASWNFRNVYFLDNMTDLLDPQPDEDIPKEFHMMRHVYRSAKYNAPLANVKSFYNPEKVLTVHNHLPHAVFPNTERTFSVDSEVGHLQHYRTWCAWYLSEVCAKEFMANPLRDTTIWRWKEQVIANVPLVLSEVFPKQE